MAQLGIAGEDNTFGNRYDDPEGQYRVLYASSARIGTFLETLARFRPDPAILAEPIKVDPTDDLYPTNPPGVVPTDWLIKRSMGTASIEVEFADGGRSRSLEYLRGRLVARLIHYGLADLDGATIRLGAPRAFTQGISRLVFHCSDAVGGPAYAGIRYHSRLGDDICNWAILEPAELTNAHEQVLSVDEPDLVEVLTRFGLSLANE